MPRPNQYARIHTVTATQTAVSPVARLGTTARSIFNSTVQTNPHLKASDVVLLTVYARTAAQVLVAKPGDAQLEKLGRLLIALGRALRINATSTTEPHTAWRRKRDAQPSALSQYLAAHPDDDDDDTET